MTAFTHIIEDSANRFWAVREPNDAALSHVYIGVLVKKAEGGFVPMGNARETLVRRAATRIIPTHATERHIFAIAPDQAA